MKLARKIFALLVAGAVLMGVSATASAQRMSNSSGSNIGRVESDGRVYNSSGSYMGRVESSGRIYNSSGSFIGEARGVDTKKAAVLFFFKLI